MVLRVLLGVVGVGAAWLAISAAMTPVYELDASERRRICEHLVGNDLSARNECAAIYRRDMEQGRKAAGGAARVNPQPHTGCREEKFAGLTQYACE